MDTASPEKLPVQQELDKLDRVRELHLPTDLFAAVPPKVLQSYRQRAAVEALYGLRRHPEPLLITLLAAYCHVRGQDLTDVVADLPRYYGEPNHQCLDNLLISGSPVIKMTSRVRRRPRLDGLLHFYQRSSLAVKSAEKRNTTGMLPLH